MNNPIRLWSFRYSTGRVNTMTGAPEELTRAAENKAWVVRKHGNCRHHKHLVATPVEGYVRDDVVFARELVLLAEVNRLRKEIGTMVSVTFDDTVIRFGEAALAIPTPPKDPL